jgi:hypothetical protein
MDPIVGGSPGIVLPIVVLEPCSYVLLSLLQSSRTCAGKVISNPVAINSTTSATKAGPLSDPIDTGILN